MAQAGLELNLTKTRIWCPDGHKEEVPRAFHKQVVDALPCLGSTISFVRGRDDDEWRDVFVGVEDAEGVTEAVRKRQHTSVMRVYRAILQHDADGNSPYRQTDQQVLARLNAPPPEVLVAVSRARMLAKILFVAHGLYQRPK